MAVPQTTMKRRSCGKAIKHSGASAKKWIASRLSGTSRNSNCSSENSEDLMYLDFEMEEEFEIDPDLFELIQHPPWILEKRASYDDDIVYWYAKNHPRSFRVRYNLDKQGRGKVTQFPLQRILALGASLRTVEAVVSAYPPALLHRHHLQRSTALHSACSFPSLFQAGVIQFLLDLNPLSVTQVNRHAFLPIHNACYASLPSPIGLEAIQILVEAYPQSILHTNKLGETPLQAARRNDKSLPDVICYLEEIQQEQQDQNRGSIEGQVARLDDETEPNHSRRCLSRFLDSI